MEMTSNEQEPISDMCSNDRSTERNMKMTIAEMIRQTTHPMMKVKLKVRTKGTIRKLLNEQGAEGEDVGCGCCAIGTEA